MRPFSAIITAAIAITLVFASCSPRFSTRPRNLHYAIQDRSPAPANSLPVTLLYDQGSDTFTIESHKTPEHSLPDTLPVFTLTKDGARKQGLLLPETIAQHKVPPDHDWYAPSYIRRDGNKWIVHRTDSTLLNSDRTVQIDVVLDTRSGMTDFFNINTNDIRIHIPR